MTSQGIQHCPGVHDCNCVTAPPCTSTHHCLEMSACLLWVVGRNSTQVDQLVGENALQLKWFVIIVGLGGHIKRVCQKSNEI